MPDLLIKNADIIDGTGAAAFRSDLVVSNGIISQIDSDIDIPMPPCTMTMSLIT